MIRSRLALKPDGLFLVAIFGGETLKELRIACTIAQMEREGGISPRISPLVQLRDAGNMLTRAGFTLPSVDVNQYTVRYKSALELIEHLRAIGETNSLIQRNHVLKMETALATAAIYDSMFGAEDGTIPATFRVIYMNGWKEHFSQQKAKRRGSATTSFEDIRKFLMKLQPSFKLGGDLDDAFWQLCKEICWFSRPRPPEFKTLFHKPSGQGFRGREDVLQGKCL